jgi:hypothetical protein
MSKRSRPEQPPPILGRRGLLRSYDPFYEFEQVARQARKPQQAPQSQRALRLETLLGSKAVLAVMGGLLVAVVVTLLVLLVARA